MANILLVEDDQGLSDGIVLVFQKENHSFYKAYNCHEALQALEEKVFDLILLDIGLPDGDGVTLCRQIRKTLSVPIIFLTANDTEFDEVAGLEAGANDYITKPFSLAVLRARVEAALRGAALQKKEQPVIKAGKLTFDFENFLFYKCGQKIFLSKTEQRLLKLFCLNPERIWERETLLNKVWGTEGEFIDENALSVTVKRLRDKLEDDPAHPVYIKTIYGTGYVWKANS